MTTKSVGVVAAALSGLFGLDELASAQGWSKTSLPTTNYWSGVASSADGRKLVAVAHHSGDQGNLCPIYTSSDYGATWITRSAPLNRWTCVACSADGTKLAAAAAGGLIYTSLNSGGIWMENDVLNFYWSSIASSADGTNLVATTGRTGINPIYTRNLLAGGSTWLETSAPYQNWAGIACSADGRRLVAVATDIANQPGSVWLSEDSGDTWKRATAPLGRWSCVASSADGRRVVAMREYWGYTSADWGETWTRSTNLPAKIWLSVASSADGTRLVAVSDGIYFSTNAGVNWTDTHAPVATWTSVASSADGSRLVAGAAEPYGTSGIYTWQSGPPPALEITLWIGEAVISWPTSAIGFGLQQNTNLTSTNWVDVTAIPTVFNQRNEVIVTNSDVACFYRLKHP